MKENWRSISSNQPLKLQRPLIQMTLMTSLCLLQGPWEKERNALVRSVLMIWISSLLIFLLFGPQKGFRNNAFSLLTLNTHYYLSNLKGNWNKLTFIWAIMTVHRSWMIDHYGFVISHFIFLLRSHSFDFSELNLQIR